MNEEFDVLSLDKIEERIKNYKRICKKHKIDETELLEFKKLGEMGFNVSTTKNNK